MMSLRYILIMACQGPGSVSGAILVDESALENSEYSLGTEVTFRCAEGYTHIDGNLTRRCTSDATWSGLSPTCTQNIEEVDTTQTLLIAAGCIVLACILCIILCRIDFYFYKKRKWRGKTIRTLGLVKKGEIRPTSFIISKENQNMLPFYLSTYYKEPEMGATDPHTLRQTLDSDMSKILGTTNSLRKAKGSFKKKKLKAKKANNPEGGRSDVCIIGEAKSEIQHPSITQSLPPETRKKKRKKKQQVEPIGESDVFQPLSLSYNSTFPMMGHSLDSYMAPEADKFGRELNDETSSVFPQPEQGQLVPEVEIRPRPTPRARTLPPRPRPEPQDLHNNKIPQLEDQVVTMDDETVTKM